MNPNDRYAQNPYELDKYRGCALRQSLYTQDKYLLKTPAVIAYIPTLSYLVGLEQSLVLQQIHYLTMLPNNELERDGYYWYYCTYKQMQAMIPVVHSTSINSAIRNLKELNLLTIGNYNKINRSAKKNPEYYDQTSWYRVNESSLRQLMECRFVEKSTKIEGDLLAEQIEIELKLGSGEMEKSRTTKEKAEFINDTISLAKFIKEYITAVHSILDNRICNEKIDNLWQIERSKAQTYYIYLVEIEASRAKLYNKFKNSNVFSEDGYYPLCILIDLMHFYAYDYENCKKRYKEDFTLSDTRGVQNYNLRLAYDVQHAPSVRYAWENIVPSSAIGSADFITLEDFAGWFKMQPTLIQEAIICAYGELPQELQAIELAGNTSVQNVDCQKGFVWFEQLSGDELKRWGKVIKTFISFERLYD